MRERASDIWSIMPLDKDPDVDVTQSADEDETSDPYIDVQIDEDEDIDSALKTWDVLVNPSYKSGLDSQLLCRAMDQRQLLQ